MKALKRIGRLIRLCVKTAFEKDWVIMVLLCAGLVAWGYVLGHCLPDLVQDKQLPPGPMRDLLNGMFWSVILLFSCAGVMGTLLGIGKTFEWLRDNWKETEDE
jgi:hypothetical protein